MGRGSALCPDTDTPPAVVAECRSLLLQSGFEELKEAEHWDIQPQRKVGGGRAGVGALRPRARGGAGQGWAGPGLTRAHTCPLPPVLPDTELLHPHCLRRRGPVPAGQWVQPRRGAHRQPLPAGERRPRPLARLPSPASPALGSACPAATPGDSLLPRAPGRGGRAPRLCPCSPQHPHVCHSMEEGLGARGLFPPVLLGSVGRAGGETESRPVPGLRPCRCCSAAPCPRAGHQQSAWGPEGTGPGCGGDVRLRR